MASPFRNPANVDLEQLFDPDVRGDGPTASFLRYPDGTPLRFAAIQYGSKGPDVGYAPIDGSDVSNLWAAAGTAVYALPFDGSQYATSVQAQSGQGGTITAVTRFDVTAAGVFNVQRGTGNPQTGSVLLGGGPVSEYSYRAIIQASQGTVNNGAATLAPVTGGLRSISVSSTVPAASAGAVTSDASVRFELYRNGVLISQSTFGLRATASGWQ